MTYYEVKKISAYLALVVICIFASMAYAVYVGFRFLALIVYWFVRKTLKYLNRCYEMLTILLLRSWRDLRIRPRSRF